MAYHIAIIIAAIALSRFALANLLRPESNPNSLIGHAFIRDSLPPAASPVSHVVEAKFEQVGRSGVPAMHAILLPDGRVVFLDKVETYTELKLKNGRHAYSSIYDPDTQKLTSLTIQSNAFCTAGGVLADGRIFSAGGSSDLKWLDPTVDNGLNKVRYLDIRNLESGWSETEHTMSSARWYGSAQVLADGSVFVASGSLNALDAQNKSNNNPTYEILDKTGKSNGVSIPMDILVRNQPYLMYPFLHLLNDGSLFVFVSKSSEIFDVAANKTTKTMPKMKGLYRTYPNSGSSVMLPLSGADNYKQTVMICGGGGWQDVHSPGDASCGLIQPMSDTPQWTYTSMPEGRCMVEGVNLLDGTILWLNGAQRGAQGFGNADVPASEALIYNPIDSSWAEAGRSNIARLYHSVALMLLDGTILVAGSNPNEMPILAQDVDHQSQYKKFPTEFRVEKWTPPYLMGSKADQRPYDIKVNKTEKAAAGIHFNVELQINFKSKGRVERTQVVLYRGGFVTHSLHMGQVMVQLDHKQIHVEGSVHQILATLPTIALAPGMYVVYVLVNGVPGFGQVISLGS